MELFLADVTISKNENFAAENMKKTPSKVAHNRPQIFFSIANKPKTNPNLIFCSIKMSPLLYNDFGLSDK